MLHVDLTCPLSSFDLEVDLRIDAGITALFGASGSGKTTLLQLIAGVRRAARGKIVLDGSVLFDATARLHVPARARRVGLVFQDLRLFPHLDVNDNLRFGYRLLADAQRGLEPADVAEALDIHGLLRRRTDQLSGGERQRVALGRTLLAMPRLLLMDEPLAAVDRRLRARILPYLRWVHERLEIPVIYVTHSLPEILELTDQVVVLAAGQLTGQGEVFEVLGDALAGDEAVGTASLLPVTVTARAPAGAALHGQIGAHQVVLPNDPSIELGSRAQIALRAEDVMLSQAPLQGVSARNQLPGRVVRISPLHGRLLVHLELGEDVIIRAELTQAALEELRVAEGAQFYCIVKTSAFRWVT